MPVFSCAVSSDCSTQLVDAGHARTRMLDYTIIPSETGLEEVADGVGGSGSAAGASGGANGMEAEGVLTLLTNTTANASTGASLAPMPIPAHSVERELLVSGPVAGAASSHDGSMSGYGDGGGGGGGDWPRFGVVAFQNVTFRYRPNLPPALQSVSFTLAGGEKLGIVGRTGAGKVVMSEQQHTAS